MNRLLPAKFKVEHNGTVRLLCINHALPAGNIPEGATITELPYDADIHCQECSEDRING